jgi:hypothetical protein
LNQRKNELTVPLRSSNGATFQIAPGPLKFDAFCTKAEVNWDDKQRDSIVVASSQAARGSHSFVSLLLLTTAAHQKENGRVTSDS